MMAQIIIIVCYIQYKLFENKDGCGHMNLNKAHQSVFKKVYHEYIVVYYNYSYRLAEGVCVITRQSLTT